MLHVAAGVYFDGYSWWWLVITLLAYLLLLAAGSFFIRWNFYLRSLHRLPMLQVQFKDGQFGISKRGKQVALTFDDGPATPTATILDILKAEQVKATFFIIGRQIAGNEALLKRIQEEGHVLGNHSFDHRSDFDWQSAKRMQAELQQTNTAISTITGQEVKLFRPPYGVTNPNLAKAIRLCGLRSIGWTLRSYDTVARDEEKLLKKLVRKSRPGSIILLHDRCAITATILPELIRQLKAEGYTFACIRQ